MLPMASAGGSNPPAPSQRRGMPPATRPWTIAPKEACSEPRLGPSRPEVIDLTRPRPQVLPGPPLQSTSVFASEGDAVDLEVCDYARARRSGGSLRYALYQELAQPASTLLEHAGTRGAAVGTHTLSRPSVRPTSISFLTGGKRSLHGNSLLDGRSKINLKRKCWLESWNGDWCEEIQGFDNRRC